MNGQNAIFPVRDPFHQRKAAPMTRVTFLIDRGEDSTAYAEDILLPLLRSLPDVLRLDAANVIASASGDVRARVLLDLYFEDETRMNQAFASAEGRRISREIMNSAGAGMEMLTSDVFAG
jgi:uncharacterized protein (TIGR02118 family)